MTDVNVSVSNVAAPSADGQAPSCPVCASPQTQMLCEVDGYRVWRCPESATDFVSPMPDDRTLAELYDREEWLEGGERGGYANYDEQTQHSVQLVDDVLDQFSANGEGRSILDVGCGYGTHLARAAERGWKCFGVEPSAHARKVCGERHGDKMYVVAQVEELIPHEFGVILLLDTIEHLKDPYALFYELFSKGTITPATRVVITTPNARSNAAVAVPADRAYRHPPSHLVYYSAESLRRLLGRLHFSDIQTSGMHASANEPAAYPDEHREINDALQSFEGLICQAQGTDFQAFMQERYVPGTWSKLAEYEHLPRYIFARQMAQGKRVLDFGCGTGYGSALLAEGALSVVGLDIDVAALAWARETHRHARLQFIQRDDLGAGLPDAAFDLITCFEVIEHVAEPMQKAAVQQFARLLAQGGVLVISTPNPEITAKYGENPYHLREMTEAEFDELLCADFSNIAMLKQWVSPGVLIGGQALPRGGTSFQALAVDRDDGAAPKALAYIAVCSSQPLPVLSALYTPDYSRDYIEQTLTTARQLSGARMTSFQQTERTANLSLHIADLNTHADNLALANEQQQRSFAQERHSFEERDTESIRLLDALQQSLAVAQASLVENEAAILPLRQNLAAKERENTHLGKQLAARDQELKVFRRSKLFRLRNALLADPWSLRKVGKIVYLTAGLVAPATARRMAAPLVTRLREIALQDTRATPVPSLTVTPLQSPNDKRPRVVHAIANFMLGGSSRLVVDLIEHLGNAYEQRVITSFIPSPPAYDGIAIEQLRHHNSQLPIIDYLQRYRPSLMHVHYWGESDKPWYDHVFKAAEQYGCKIIENVNTPVEPWLSDKINHYVFVSDYVRTTFGVESNKQSTIYPGSDFSLFAAENAPPDDCIGMVYRLERDKLNENAIAPFIQVAQARPQTKIVIVGGGTYLQPYKEAASAAGVLDCFDFTGYVAYADLPAYYRWMSVFVAPVWKESFGQVLPFAMNMGIPVVGYDVGALHEIIGDAELLAPPGDSARLAQIIIDLLDDRERRLRIGRENRQRAEKLSVDAMVREYRTLYDQLLTVG
ncbi:MAG: putative S-adenosylmethionine-dependent methyltransferase [Chromatiales bacterium USCg_Taylor]|nr:MAG: putative S-adenosylmethionine-dependent methyltransferase [Chromatiales bacterium USCg_Taylor]